MDTFGPTFCCGSNVPLDIFLNATSELKIAPPSPESTPRNSVAAASDLPTAADLSFTGPVPAFVVNPIFPTDFRKNGHPTLPASQRPPKQSGDNDDLIMDGTAAHAKEDTEAASKRKEKRPWKKIKLRLEGDCGIPIRESDPACDSSKNAELVERTLKEQLIFASRNSIRSVRNRESSKDVLARKRYGSARPSDENLPAKCAHRRALVCDSLNTTATCVGNMHPKESTVVTPSNRSTFSFTPNYFKPEVLRECKFDADLATAIAQSSGRSLRAARKGGAVRLSENIHV